MYGKAEGVVGDLLAAAGTRDKAFLATKVWTSGREAGIAQMNESFRLLRTNRIDLMQIHNLLDWQTHLPTLRAWKKEGRIRLLGVTHYTESAHGALEATLKTGGFDFVQVDYSLDDREAVYRVLPAAAEVKAAVLTALPFGRARLFRAVRGKEVPDWARSFADTWAQFFLKYLLSDPRVTAVIPGTADPAHMTDNLGAMRGPLPDPDQRKKMDAFAATL
jgi:diketogulonate reductase-like aldo/keto reductase